MPIRLIDDAFVAEIQEGHGYALANSETGDVVHEVGHYLAGLSARIPADFIFFNWTPNQDTRHAVYYDTKMQGLIWATPRRTCDLRAAGICAEYQVFGVSYAPRSTDDRASISELISTYPQFFQRQARSSVQYINDNLNPFTADDRERIIDISNSIIGIINAQEEEGPIFIIPSDRIPKRFKTTVPFLRRILSDRRSVSRKYHRNALDQYMDNQ